MKKLLMKDKFLEQMQELLDIDNQQVSQGTSQILEIYQALKLIQDNQEIHVLQEIVLLLTKIESQLFLYLDLVELLQLQKPI